MSWLLLGLVVTTPHTKNPKCLEGNNQYQAPNQRMILEPWEEHQGRRGNPPHRGEMINHGINKMFYQKGGENSLVYLHVGGVGRHREVEGEVLQMMGG